MNLNNNFFQAFWDNFLGTSPDWYKKTILLILLLNPVLLLVSNGFITGCFIVVEFIFTLAMALRCYPLQPGGLIVLEAMCLGLTSPATLRLEVINNFPVILLLMFMVAGVYFMRELLMFIFTKLLVHIQSNMRLAFLFCSLAAVLSAFLDALTLIAVIISIGVGFYAVYHAVASGMSIGDKLHQLEVDDNIPDSSKEDLKNFQAFLRGLLMHAAVGTALGGVCTTVGEPQNLLIAHAAGWDFIEFYMRMAPVTMPVLIAGLGTCMLLEHFKLFGYGNKMPATVRSTLEAYDAQESQKRTVHDQAKLIIQAASALLLMLALGFHIAEVGFIGLMIIVLQTALNGTIEEHRLGAAFHEALPFTALLVIFFGVVAVIEDNHLFQPVINWVLQLPENYQPGVLYIVNGLLSAISDNVFVATVYINEIKAALTQGLIDRPLFNQLVIAINTGTNLPSVATPNGQAAFLFLLTSSLAPLIQLSYGRMLFMALPYAIVMSVTGLLAILFIL